jgi:hypothetical protein
VADAVGELWDLDGRELFESGCYPGGVGSTTLEESDGAAGYDLREGREMADRWAFQGNERKSTHGKDSCWIVTRVCGFLRVARSAARFQQKDGPLNP